MRRVELPKHATGAAVRRFVVTELHLVVLSVPTLASNVKPVTNSVAAPFPGDIPSLLKNV